MSRTALTVAGLVALASCAGRGDAEPPPQWNVILISLDTCRSDRLSAYGYERRTPNLDGFSSQATLFLDCLSQSTITGPSHLSMLTGQHVARHGLGTNRAFPVVPYTLATLLRESGWSTAAFTGHGPLQAQYADVLGFEVLESWEGPPAPPFSRDMHDVLPQATRWLEQRDDRPFFLFVHGFDPHCPYWPATRWREPVASWYRGPLEAESLCNFNLQPIVERGEWGPEERRYVSDLYDAEVAAADHAIGMFLGHLSRTGLLADSIVIFTSDHGEVLGAHGRLGHGRMFEEELRVPLAIRFPQERWKGAVEAPVQHVDLVPTLLSVLGLERPDGIQGLDLMPLLRGDEDLPADRLRVCRTKDLIGLRAGDRFKAVFELDGDDLTEPRLFDLVEDPGELSNLYDTASGREQFDDLVGRWSEWRASAASDDARWRGRDRDEVEVDDAMLQSLGYVDGASDSDGDE